MAVGLPARPPYGPPGHSHEPVSVQGFPPPPVPPLGPSPLRSAPRGRPRSLALASAPSRPSTPRQARCLVFRLFGEGFFGAASTRFVPSLRSGPGISSSAAEFNSVPTSGLIAAFVSWRGGVGECRRGFSRAPRCAGRAEGGGEGGMPRRALASPPGPRVVLPGVVGCPGPFCVASAPARPSAPRRVRCLVCWLFGEGFFGSASTRFIPSLRSGAGVLSLAVDFDNVLMLCGREFSQAALRRFVPSLRSGP